MWGRECIINILIKIDYEIQKMCSISASMATMAFNRIFAEKVKNCDKIYIMI